MDGLVPCCRLCLPFYAALVHIPQVVAHFVDHAPPMRMPSGVRP